MRTKPDITVAPHISDDINRTFEDRSTFAQVVVVTNAGGYGGWGTLEKVQTVTKPVVIHYGETDYEIQIKPTKQRKKTIQMNKTDKVLYGGFAVVAIASIEAMLVSVFSPPKQKAEETVKTPKNEQPILESTTPDVAGTQMPQIPDGYVGYYLDDDGNKVYVTQKQLDAGKAYEEELKRKEAERLAKEKVEREWWDSKQEWIERFPFEPTHQLKITFDPTVYDINRK